MNLQMLEQLLGSLRGRQGARKSGAAAVELAITAPLLVFLVLGVADYGDLMNSAAAILAGTRAGAEVVKANQNVTAAQLTALNIFPSGATPSISAPFCTCVDNTSVTCPGPGAANPCAATADTRVLKYLTVSATQNFTPLFSVTNFFSLGGFTFPSSLSATVDVRLQ
jgi:Flp pilus assembly protein TadG